jgi:hypothetical protein
MLTLPTRTLTWPPYRPHACQDRESAYHDRRIHDAILLRRELDKARLEGWSAEDIATIEFELASLDRRAR